MKRKFFCDNCNKVFEAEGIKKEYNHPVYGPCVSFHAFCSDCQTECREFVHTKKIKLTGKNANTSSCSGFGCSCNQ